jgi:predicted O-methyltransferase YrrM
MDEADDLKRAYEDMGLYLEQCLEDDPIYRWIAEETKRRGLPLNQVTPVQGRLLNLLVRLLDARYVLEIGTLCGYSGVWLARALPRDGRLFTVEKDPACWEVAREAFSRSGLANRIGLYLGSALEVLARLELQQLLDLVFIDADKDNTRVYFDWAQEHVRSGGLVVVDNVPVVRADIVETNAVRVHSQAAIRFNEHVFSRHADWGTLLPFYRPTAGLMDGLLIYRLP